MTILFFLHRHLSSPSSPFRRFSDKKRKEGDEAFNRLVIVEKFPESRARDKKIGRVKIPGLVNGHPANGDSSNAGVGVGSSATLPPLVCVVSIPQALSAVLICWAL